MIFIPTVCCDWALRIMQYTAASRRRYQDFNVGLPSLVSSLLFIHYYFVFKIIFVCLCFVLVHFVTPDPDLNRNLTVNLISALTRKAGAKHLWRSEDCTRLPSFVKMICKSKSQIGSHKDRRTRAHTLRASVQYCVLSV